MINLYNYIKSNIVKNVYLKNLWRIKGYSEYQHFLSRLSIVDKTVKVNKEIYSVKIDELKHIIASNPNKMWELALEQDNNGYLKELNEVITQEIKYYVYYCRIFDNLNILRRNNIDFDFESVKHFFDDEIVEKMCNISYNETLRELEGTICVNGIGYLLPFIDSYISEKSRKIVLKAFVDVVTEELKNGGKIQSVGFGTFEVSERAAREGRNPQTGASMTIAASKSPKYLGEVKSPEVLDALSFDETLNYGDYCRVGKTFTVGWVVGDDGSVGEQHYVTVEEGDFLVVSEGFEGDIAQNLEESYLRYWTIVHPVKKN